MNFLVCKNILVTQFSFNLSNGSTVISHAILSTISNAIHMSSKHAFEFIIGHDKYRQTSNISHDLVCNKIIYHSDVVGSSPVDVAPTTSSLSTKRLASLNWAKATARLGGGRVTRFPFGPINVFVYVSLWAARVNSQKRPHFEHVEGDYYYHKTSPREPHALAWGPSSFHTKIFRVEWTRLKTVEKDTDSL